MCFQKCPRVRTGVEKLALLANFLERSPVIGKSHCSSASYHIQRDRQTLTPPGIRRVPEFASQSSQRTTSMSSCTLSDHEYFSCFWQNLLRDHWKFSDKLISWVLKAFSKCISSFVFHTGQVLSSFWVFAQAVPVSV